MTAQAQAQCERCGTDWSKESRVCPCCKAPWIARVATIQGEVHSGPQPDYMMQQAHEIEGAKRAQREGEAMPVPGTKAKVWRSATGLMFHDKCFDTDESREGFTPVDLNDLEEDDTCEACSGTFLNGPAAIEEDDEDDEDED